MDKKSKEKYVAPHELIGMDYSTEDYIKYRRKGGLIVRKLMEYIPVMILTNISLFLINTVDKIVAGNFVSAEAMESISIFFPALLITSAFSGPVASGIATTISNAMGKNDLEELAHANTVGARLVALTAIITGIIQIPIILFLIKSYGVNPELTNMMWQYGIGCMICTPIATVSTAGTYQLQIAGKMKVIMVLTIIEGVGNLVFDLLFVAVIGMGVEGTGYGTAVSNLLRCIITVVYMKKYTDFYKGDGKKVTLQECLSTIRLGLPECAFMLMLSFQNYFTIRILLSAFETGGGVIYGLCSFCLSLVGILFTGIQGGMRPLMGLYSGAGDKQGLSELVRHGYYNVLIYAGVTTVAIMLLPATFYHIHGIQDIPPGGILSVRLFALAFIFRGFDYVLRLYLINRQDIRFTTILTVLGNATLPLFAFLISLTSLPAPYIFLAYLFTELLVHGLSTYRYLHFKKLDKNEPDDAVVLYLTVNKEDAVEASKYIREVADRNGIEKGIAFKVALCMEEMVAYIEESERLSLMASRTPSVDIIVRFEDANHGMFISLDDGAFIALDKDAEKQELITDNYELVKCFAKEVEYQYILNMNYSKFIFY
ncbi:MAG: polysaccharide biosynthesis C-terminal domain-containing protein [Firmicutes bacterium]|nr:polysaccharide biosynthesis C-terminal domain-containing protein [Bacillota bacterium]